MDGRRDPSGSQATIGYMHHLVHEGKLFYLNRRVRGSAAAVEILVRVGALPLHVSIVAKAGAASPADIIRGVSVTNTGTSLPFRNYNETYQDDALLSKAFHSPTYTGGEVRRENQAGFGTNPGVATSGDTNGGDRHEYWFRPNTDYVIKVAPTTTTDVVIIADCYERMRP